MKTVNQIILTMIAQVIMITMLHEKNDKHDKIYHQHTKKDKTSNIILS